MHRVNLIVGVLLLGFSALFYFYLIPTQIVTTIPQDQIVGIALRPEFLPRISILLFAFLSVVFTVDALRHREDDLVEGASGRSLFQVGVVFLIGCIYNYALELVGFVASSPFFLAALIMFFGTMNWRYVVPVAVLLPLALRYFFWLGFEVILPEGSIW
ncbi:tripartite tricarboxylate transporter TctB family protein [Nitrospinota bacterium]